MSRSGGNSMHARIEVSRATARSSARVAPVQAAGEPLDLWDEHVSTHTLRERATQRLRGALHEGRAIALLGAGQTGILVARALGKAAHCFLDDTADKQGTTMLGLPVHAVDDGLRGLPEQALVVVCIFSARHRWPLTRERVQRLRPDCDVASFAEVAHLFQQGLPNLYLDDLARQASLLPRLRTLRTRLADERSRQVLDEHLRMRLLADFRASTDPRDALGFLGLDAEPSLSFVDGGAFDGDTVRDFLAWHGGRFGRIVACEPDAGNAQRLRAYTAGLDGALRDRIEVRETALWSSRGTHAFAATARVASSLVANGGSVVATETLDAMDHLPDPLLVKLDVEGAEAEVLRAAQPWLRRRCPTLAVSVYHRPADLVELFELLDAMGLPYRYHLRCHGGDGTDLMLYCAIDTASRSRSQTRFTLASSR
jgi:FkbM family methyltransferase